MLAGLLALCSCCFSEEGDARSLKGIKAVYVMVDSAVAAAVPGLNNDIVKAEVEAQLRSFGITVDKPPILLRVSYIGAPGLMYGVFLKLSQRVALERNPSIQVLINTWGTDRTVMSGVANNFAAIDWTGQTIHDAIKELVNQFLAVWLDQNPEANSIVDRPK